MNELEIHIVELPPTWVASLLGFGESPEGQALDKVKAWAAATGADLHQQRMFGFNNPSPTTGSPHYGYEMLVEVAQGTAPAAGAEIKSFPGGRYAVTRVTGVDNIAPTWQRFSAWLENSPYRMGHHQWLEEHIGVIDLPLEEYVLDLYLPLAG